LVHIEDHCPNTSLVPIEVWYSILVFQYSIFLSVVVVSRFAKGSTFSHLIECLVVVSSASFSYDVVNTAKPTQCSAHDDDEARLAVDDNGYGLYITLWPVNRWQLVGVRIHAARALVADTLELWMRRERLRRQQQKQRERGNAYRTPALTNTYPDRWRSRRPISTNTYIFEKRRSTVY
jgi:hypothetical protein